MERHSNKNSKSGSPKIELFLERKNVYLVISVWICLFVAASKTGYMWIFCFHGKARNRHNVMPTRVTRQLNTFHFIKNCLRCIIHHILKLLSYMILIVYTLCILITISVLNISYICFIHYVSRWKPSNNDVIRHLHRETRLADTAHF